MTDSKDYVDISRKGGRRELIRKFTGSLSVLFNNEAIQLPENVKEAIEENWRRAENDYLTNGKIMTIGKIDSSDNNFKITMQPTTYNHYMATQQIPDKVRELPCTVLFGAALLETSDNYLTIIQMGDRTSCPDRLQLIGGSLDMSDVSSNNTIDLYANISREVKEEIGIEFSKNDIRISDKYLIKVFESNTDRESIVVINHIKANISKDALKKQLHQHNQESIDNGEFPELKDVFFVKSNREAMISFVEENKAHMENHISKALIMAASNS